MPAKTVEALDKELHEIIEAVEHAANYGMAHRDEPKVTGPTLQDCEELLKHVMDATVLES